MINIITFDMVPGIDGINAYLFTSRYSEGPTNQPAIGFELNGFENQNYMKNTGSMFIFASWMILSSIFFKMVRQCALRFWFFTYFYRKFRVNEDLNALMMRFVMQGYTELLISSLITIQLASKLDVIIYSW